MRHEMDVSQSGPDLSRALPNYGIDGPRWMWGFLVTSMLALVAGVIAIRGEFPLHGAISGLLWMMSGITLALGLSMLSYAYLGKQRLRDHLLRQWRWQGDETVLDVGAGRGLMAIGAAKRAPMGRVMALDVWSNRDLSGNSPAALLRNAAIENVANVEVVTGDARRLDLPDGSVDVVMSVFCLHNIEPEAERLKACTEIARVLKTGGLAMIADFPGAGRYVDAFTHLGLGVKGPFRSERIGLGISGYIIAEKTA